MAENRFECCTLLSLIRETRFEGNRRGGIVARKWTTLRAKMAPERREANRAAARQMIDAMPLEELRTARNITQTHLASLLRITQASVSKMEKRTDMYVSTLRSFVQAMGGELEIRAVFPEGTVRINQFATLVTDERSGSAAVQSAEERIG
jgi:hypothetical protein